MKIVKSRPALAPLLAVLVVGGIYGFSELSTGTSSRVPGRSAVDVRPSQKSADSGTRVNPFIETEGPLFQGEEIPLEVATTLLRECSCPQLPTTGPASPEHVSEAWLDPQLGKVALVFDNQVTIIVTPGDETREEFVAGWQEMIDAGDWMGHFLPLRNTTAAGSDIGENSSLATLHWQEGALISMYGEGAQTLTDLSVIAESFLYCLACTI